jgi:Galactose oxidase-like, Early set domain
MGLALASSLSACNNPFDDDDDEAQSGSGNEMGKWTVLRTDLTMTPIHAALMRTGEVLFWAPDLTRNPDHNPGSPNAWPYINDMERVSIAMFDPASGRSRSLPMNNPRNLFCAGQSFLPDGRLFVAGGHAFPGVLGRGADHDVHLFDSSAKEWDRLDDMPLARWYPTCTTLEDGKILIVSGFFNGVPPNPTTWPLGALVNPFYDLFDPTTERLSAASGRVWMPPLGEQTLYPFVKLLPGGTLFVHNKQISRLWVKDPAAQHPLGRTRTAHVYVNVASNNFRTYPGQGACVILPLSTSATTVRILVAGGGGETGNTIVHDTPATNTAEIFEFRTNRTSQRQDGWRPIASMKNRRFMSDGVLLPDQSVLLSGGSGIGKADDNNNPVLEPELFNSRDETWRAVASQNVPRRYHSVALLLPDGRVLSAGSTANWPHPPWPLDDRHPPVIPERRLEVYEPPYLFRGTRPSIGSAPASVKYGAAFSFELAKRMRIKTVALLRPAAVTHTNDMDQRHVELDIEGQSGRRITVRAPEDGTWAPPGWYMLFALNNDDVPSRAVFIRLS